ncbi:MAG: tRNA (N6-isopentenyl adenosine(37)-C2)-methylthiotransferase MiaB, partial [Blastomonas fulva]
MSQSTDTLVPPSSVPDAEGGPRRYFVTSFGCQMNVYDGERMGEMLSAQGMQAAD